MSFPKNQEQRDRIVYLYDIEGRNNHYIASLLGISETAVKKLYHSEKTLLAIRKQKENHE